MTTLNFAPIDEPTTDLLSLVADASPVMADVFRAACIAEGREHDGWVNPNAVNARCRRVFADANATFPSRSYSAQWSKARGPEGFLYSTEIPVQIDGKGSKGNGNKALDWHRLRT